MDSKLHTELKKDDPPLILERNFLDRWFVERMIAVGGFGQVFVGHDSVSGRWVAIKVESTDASFPLLANEAQCLQHANALQTKSGDTSEEPFLHFYAFGKTPFARYLVMDLCGPNVRELKKGTPYDRFSTITSLWLMYKMIGGLRHLHHNGWVHRDVKPANFCISYSSGLARLYIIDFGMCRYFLRRDGSLRLRKDHSAFHGTVRYASLNTHRRKDLCRWDDLWSVFYITCENLLGSLPWRLLADKDEVMRMKESIDLLKLPYVEEPQPPMSVCSLYAMLQRAFVDEQAFYSAPDYDSLLNEINSDLSKRNCVANIQLDWELPPVNMQFSMIPCMQRNPAQVFSAPPVTYSYQAQAFGDLSSPHVRISPTLHPHHTHVHPMPQVHQHRDHQHYAGAPLIVGRDSPPFKYSHASPGLATPSPYRYENAACCGSFNDNRPPSPDVCCTPQFVNGSYEVPFSPQFPAEVLGGEPAFVESHMIQSAYLM